MEDRSSRDPSGLGPLDRLALAALAWEKVGEGAPAGSVEQDSVMVDRAKGAVMLRYGVNSHVALAMLARWARDTHVSTTAVARALVDQVVGTGRLPDDHEQIGAWLRARSTDFN